YQGIVVRPAGEWRCDILLVLVSEVAEAAMLVMQQAYEANAGELSIVLVANTIQEKQVLRAVKFGLVSLLDRQETDFDRIVGAIAAASDHRAALPGAVLRYIIDQARAIERGVLALHGMSGLAAREIEVLKLLADGMDTGAVAAQLNYSERTVKNI